MWTVRSKERARGQKSWRKRDPTWRKSNKVGEKVNFVGEKKIHRGSFVPPYILISVPAFLQIMNFDISILNGPHQSHMHIVNRDPLPGDSSLGGVELAVSNPSALQLHF